MSQDVSRRKMHIWSSQHMAESHHDVTPSKAVVEPCERGIVFIDKDSIDPYKILALRRDATFAEIGSSYRRLAILKHPRRQRSSGYSDSMSNSTSKNNREWDFLVLSACYEILKTPRYRRAYDDLYRRQERRNARLLLQRQQLDARSRRKKGIPNDSLHPIMSDGGFTCLRIGGGGSPHHHIFRSKEDPDETTSTTTSAPSTQCDVGAFLKLSFDSDEGRMQDSPSLENSFSGDDEEFQRTSIPEDFENKSEMYQGPLELLYRARNYENFSDPYELFRDEFGSDVFSSNPATTSIGGDDGVDELLGNTFYNSPYKKESSLSFHESYNKDSLIKNDSWDEDVACTTHHGDVSVTKTSRIINGSKITRIETMKTDPNTGKKLRIVEVRREEEDSGDDDDDDECLSDSIDMELSMMEPNPLISCLAGGNHSNLPSPVHNVVSVKDKDKLSLRKLLFGCGRFIP